MNGIDRAMVLAAGLGLRMRPLTETMPKPLVPVLGKPLIDYALDTLGDAGIASVVVNTHYLPDQLAAHLAGRDGIRLSHEETLLETGGGVKHALPLLGDAPFFVVNSDGLMVDGPTPALVRMRECWDPARMDVLLLLQPTVRLVLYRGFGDFHLDPNGQAKRRRESEVAAFLFTGTQILHPGLFADTPDGPFSLNLIYDRAQESGRLYGIVHDGDWYHVGSPEELALTETAMSEAIASVNSR
jgi:MurNAc alpha-1-phosphate uridylyltransferase